MTFTSLFGRLLPLPLRDQLRNWKNRHRDRIRFSGDYSTWEAASQQSAGYDTETIFQKTRNAIRQVRDGKAEFERDSLLISPPEYPFPLLTCLYQVLLQRGYGGLNVLDFGGSLGSSYFQCRKFFPQPVQLRWSVVEQPHYVQCGREEFETDQLRFFRTISEAMEKEKPDVILMSGVLAYLKTPYELLEEVVTLPIPYMIIDRHPIIEGERDHLTIQKVPKEIYPASYPAWFFSGSKFSEFIKETHHLILDYRGSDGSLMVGDLRTTFRGFFYIKLHLTNRCPST